MSRPTLPLANFQPHAMLRLKRPNIAHYYGWCPTSGKLIFNRSLRKLAFYSPRSSSIHARKVHVRPNCLSSCCRLTSTLVGRPCGQWCESSAILRNRNRVVIS